MSCREVTYIIKLLVQAREPSDSLDEPKKMLTRNKFYLLRKMFETQNGDQNLPYNIL